MRGLTMPGPGWYFSAPPPPWRDAATLQAVLAALSPAMQWGLDRVMQQGGRGCGVPDNTLYALERRDLLVVVVDGRTQGWRGCGHPWCLRYWYHVLPEVEAAYRAWAQQWEAR